jgi:hypothetical protein
MFLQATTIAEEILMLLKSGLQNDVSFASCLAAVEARTLYFKPAG